MPRGVSIYDEAKLQRRLWTPALLPMLSWWDFTDISTISQNSDTSISAIRDKSGNGHTASQVTSGAGPRMQTSPQPLALFSRTGGYNRLTCTAITQPIGSTYGGFCFVPTVLESYPLVFGTNAVFAFYINGTVYFFQDSANNTNGTTAIGSGWQVCTWYYQSGTLTFRVNGAVYMAVTGRTGNVSYASIGNDGSNGALTGSISEIIVCPALKNFGDIYRLEGSMAWKIGQQGQLPANHPYKNTPPVIGN